MVSLLVFNGVLACGTDSPASSLSRIEYDAIESTVGGSESRSASSGASVASSDNDTDSGNGADASVDRDQEPRTTEIISTDGVYGVDDFVNLGNFKKSKEYDVEGLDGATGAIYGFFGPDPYDRQEFEIRFYPDHETAVTVGVDFANESTGPDAVIAKDLQRWDEGLTQRRSCQGNIRGSHHSGKCDNAKYADYVVAGNVVVLCQGRDSKTSLANCYSLMEGFQ